MFGAKSVPEDFYLRCDLDSQTLAYLVLFSSNARQSLVVMSHTTTWRYLLGTERWFKQNGPFFQQMNGNFSIVRHDSNFHYTTKPLSRRNLNGNRSTKHFLGVGARIDMSFNVAVRMWLRTLHISANEIKSLLDCVKSKPL